MRLIKTAFTLIELLVVIAIIGILSGLIVVTMSGVTQKATIAKSQVFSNSLRNALMLNLVSQYTFDIDGTDSWGPNTGTITGATITSSGCVFNSCLNSTGGSSNRVSIPDSSSLNSVWSSSHIFTLEAWIYSTFYAGYQGIINKRTSNYYSASPGGLFIGSDGDTMSFLIGTGNDSETSTAITYSLANMHNMWIHVVGTSDGSNLRLYINSVASPSNPKSFSQNPPVNSDPATIGAFYAGSRAFSGKIDNVRLYSAAVPVSQIKEQYYAGLNRLLAHGGVSRQEYASRILDLNNGYAIN